MGIFQNIEMAIIQNNLKLKLQHILNIHSIQKLQEVHYQEYININLLMILKLLIIQFLNQFKFSIQVGVILREYKIYRFIIVI